MPALFQHPALAGILPAESGGIILPLDEARLAQAQARLDGLAKPRGSLGRLEEIALRLACLRHPCEVAPAVIFTCAADHGVAEELVSPFPQSVTRAMVENFLQGGAAINALTGAAGMDLAVVDAGCRGGAFADPSVINLRLGDGTANLAKGPAMDVETCLKGLASGCRLAGDWIARGWRCLGIGEMGIANTTPATALYCQLLGLAPKEAAGPGTGADPAMVARKAEVVARALHVNRDRLSAQTKQGLPDPVAALACLGGFEIALMAGIVLGSASLQVPVLIDGFIASAAYACAVLAAPACADYAFVAHASAEPGHQPAMERLARLTPHPAWGRPLLHLGMRLGEGTGAAMAYPLLKGACALYANMASLADVGVAGPSA